MMLESRRDGKWGYVRARVGRSITLGPVVALVVLIGAPPLAASQACIGNCDNSAAVTERDLIRMTDIALGHAPVSACEAGDANHDGRITVDEIVQAILSAFGECVVAAPGQTLDDLLEAVARSVPGFGGMLLAGDEQVLQVYLLDPSPENVTAVTAAITEVFGPIIPQGGIQALPGQYGFVQLREWYRAMVGRVLSTAGVTATDINEAVNRLVIGIERPETESQVAQVLTELDIPSDAVVIVVTGPIEPLSNTLQDAQSPRQGGFQIVRLINNTTGFGIATPTLGFNALRSSIPGIVTNSHNSQVFWNLDTNAGFPPADFYQASGYFPSELIATETVDPQGFPCAAPYPAGYTCRYSDSLFADYKSGVAWDPGVIGKTTGQTVLSSSTGNLNLTVDPSSRFTVVAPPSQPYLVGLPLHKVGRTTGWTSGAIQYAYFPSTCADFVDSQHRVRLCQYTVTDPQLGLATFGDSGSPVFRVIDSQCGYVELYGLLWGGSNFFVPPAPWTGGSVAKMFVFSPLGGVSFQQTGVQSASDLGPLRYTGPGMCTPGPATRPPGPTPTPTSNQPCGFVGPRMCGGSCLNLTDVCQPLPDDSGCECQPAATFTTTPTPPTVTHTGTLSPAVTPTATPTGCVSGPLSNLVLNPGFESFSSVPSGLGQINLAISWLTPTNGSPDYLHSLAAASSGVGVPANTFGNEAPHGGRAYAGFHARPPNAYREYVEGSLSTPLAAGNTYQVSFYLSLADGSRWAVDKLGAYFSIGAVGPVNTADVLPVTPQVTVSGYVTNKAGWTQILGSYTAVGGEDHIVIGNFLDNPSTTPLAGQGGSFDFAYYYVDDVSVTLAAAPCTPTPTPSATGTPTASSTPTPIATCPGALCTPTPTPSRTATPSVTRTPSAGLTPSVSATPTRSATPSVTPACVPPPADMVAWWPLDESTGATSLQDVIGANDATPFASPVGAAQAPQATSGVVAGAIGFPKFGNGLSSAQVGPAGALAAIGSADLTIDAWVQFPPAAADRPQYVVNRFDAAQNRGYALYIVSSATTGNHRLEFTWGDGTNVGTVSSIAPLSVNQWHHVAATFARNVGGNAVDVRLYVDGVEQGQQVGNPPGLGSLANFLVLEIGAQPGVLDQDITIDELEIFSRALAQQEIQDIFGAGAGGKCK